MINLIPDDISPYRIVYYGCRISGLMNDKGRPWSLIYTGYHWFIINASGIAAKICFGNGNSQEIIEAMSSFTILLQVWSKLINYALKGEKIRNLLDRLETTRRAMLEDEENKHYVLEADKRCRKFVTILAFSYLSCPLMQFIFTTFYDFLTNFENKHLFFHIWIPWNVDNDYLYMIAKVYETLIALSGTIIYTSFGILEFTFTIQMSAYLKILQNHLQKKRPKEKMIYKTHVSLVISISTYNKLLSGQKYLEIVVSSVMPCGFILTLMRAFRRYELNQFDKIQTMILLLTAPCILCLCGQAISTEMERLHESSYMNTWYEEAPNERKDLLVLMIRTTKPTRLSYRMFMTFDHACLATVMQGLYSYLTMIIHFDTS